MESESHADIHLCTTVVSCHSRWSLDGSRIDILLTEITFSKLLTISVSLLVKEHAYMYSVS